MSIFARPASPPPRVPSPDHFTGFSPLPIRKPRSHPSIRPTSRDELLPPKPASSPSSSSSTLSTVFAKTLSPRRSLSFTVPYLSPTPTSSAIAMPPPPPPPPVPPIPALVPSSHTEQNKRPKAVERKTRSVDRRPLTCGLFSLCTSGRSVAVCTA